MSERKHQAIALNWNPYLDAAPKITAKGSGLLADEIIRLAREHNIPIREDQDLVQIFSQLDIGASVPAEVHTAIAEILAYIYWSNQQYTDIFDAD
ncbi:MAG: flagellar biosynthesis protein FlhB [Zetaproteobacteria bacterium CG12_big_fil_rev_8_21_14_0_65_54_13]|nr:MAG: flagellar biosynthesis protein FlhB [Zetaproteobacteria bacterium CG23_combo_of_CG06-09_8_20_14_all_54_7]PIW46683.1 MAG: flagellar biosynthesis protein FlhB [Zetaproteobacteria bacterium CG12_big_fil_rev_8_21_14_0_65_54_13]PIX53689.1 MAG: flagellar biosynthesis protein FlhB [Zetaproteobacteria bacterium CG_4_10_14_3_um_filter_54_28]PJA27216.1 MAG: flagellar biosynthesis protein FlhB [Zetaproteobacteria bacterium CG_4_9_14_3_um_filter_54_145]